MLWGYWFCRLYIVGFSFSECCSKPPCKWCHSERRYTSSSGGTLHVWPSRHDYFGRLACYNWYNLSNECGVPFNITCLCRWLSNCTTSEVETNNLFVAVYIYLGKKSVPQWYQNVSAVSKKKVMMKQYLPYLSAELLGESKHLVKIMTGDEAWVIQCDTVFNGKVQSVWEKKSVKVKFIFQNDNNIPF